MIENEAQFEQTQRQLRLMQDALRSLRVEVWPKNKRNFAVLAEGPLQEIQRLQEEIDTYTGITAARESESPIWMSLFGEQIHWPAAPTSLLTSYLASFRKGVQAVAEFLQHGQVSGGRPAEILKSACDFEVVAFQPGSIRIGLRLPDGGMEGAPRNQQVNPAEQALDEFLAVASWAASDEANDVLESKIADTTKRRVLLNALKPLLPGPRGQVEGIELSGWRVRGQTAIRLSRETNAKVDNAIDRTVHDQVETHEGYLKEIDLDGPSFTLRQRENLSEVRCAFEEDILEQAKAALDKRIRVTGSRRVAATQRASPVLQVKRLEVLEETDEDAKITHGDDSRNITVGEL